MRNSSRKNLNHPHLCFRIDLFYSFSYFSPSFTTFFFGYGVLITHKHYSRGQPLRPPLFFSPYKGSRSQAVFIQTVNGSKSYLKSANVSYTNEIKETITSQKLGSYNFWRTANRVSVKVNLLVLRYSFPFLMRRRWYLKCFQEALLRMTHVTHYLFSLPTTNQVL